MINDIYMYFIIHKNCILSSEILMYFETDSNKYLIKVTFYLIQHMNISLYYNPHLNKPRLHKLIITPNLQATLIFHSAENIVNCHFNSSLFYLEILQVF